MNATTEIGAAPGVVSADGLVLRRRRAWPLAALAAVLRFMRRKPLGAVGLVTVLVLLFCAAFAPSISPYSYEKQDLRNRFAGPSADHFLGTDDRGRDMFSRVLYGARVSVFVGFGVIATSMVLATAVGLLTGYYGGTVDLVVQRLVDILLSVPFLILAITLWSMMPKTDRIRDLGPLSLKPEQQAALYIVLALGFSFSIGASRVVRGAVFGIKGNTYMEAARALGATDGRMLVRYILPNIFPTVLILATVQLGAAILAESSLQFLGFGIPPPVPSWGGMLGGVARTYITKEPLLSIWPGLAIAITVFGFNMLGDALRDVLDPRLRGSR